MKQQHRRRLAKAWRKQQRVSWNRDNNCICRNEPSGLGQLKREESWRSLIFLVIEIVCLFWIAIEQLVWVITFSLIIIIYVIFPSTCKGCSILLVSFTHKFFSLSIVESSEWIKMGIGIKSTSTLFQIIGVLFF